LFSVLYSELHRQARSRMRRERSDHTLSATALTHELWFRLSEQTRTVWQSQQHFLAVAGILMRRILVNHAQARAADKRQGDHVDWTESLPVAAPEPTPELLRVHEALLAFEAIDARAAKVVELKFFAGLEGEEIAAVLGVSVPTVKRDWAWARAWLHRELSEDAPALDRRTS
jgi:RNA polymerase sigma factor (TIGR02999 family)